MSVGFMDNLRIKATLVANEFIDQYMISANGEYVKVYLYLLRHQDENVDISDIADHLNHTEADVKRALTYWTKAGVLKPEVLQPDTLQPDVLPADALQADASRADVLNASRADVLNADTGRAGRMTEQPSVKPLVKTQAKTPVKLPAKEHAATVEPEQFAVLECEKEPEQQPVLEKPSYSPYQLSKLTDNEEFAQLLYVAQKYTGTIFSHKDCEVFAYLYEALGMSFDLLVHLVASCVQAEHREVRYMEAVALNWHKNGVKTVDQAKQGTELYVKGYAGVMKAFGLSGRKPGASEHDLIRKWFYTYMFSPTLVTEACNRTMRALHQPSFEYADKILASWKEAGVRNLDDVKKLDQAREGERQQKNEEGRRWQTSSRTDKNQFHNFKQRDTDYNALVMERLKERLNEQANQQQ
ncbi:DnaD domain protein [Clostridium sp. MCC353]|uniref:DnaD domain protein n=1 Tax=Clostridium sp. MCC353 TaxID=2592646 RepID=UPI001C020E3E|nr:DnaD domain protein [Clostridium sp. MCC353]MBT9779106.1 DnaD domain protein [Clostridium sp. MCC353]